MLRLPLRGEVGRDRDNDTADVLAAKRALARLGYYAPPDYGFDGYSDRPFEDGLRTYQAERGLRQDGWAAPGGETHRNIDLDLSGEKRPFGHDLPRDARFTGSVGVNADNERPDVQLAQRLLGALGLYRYDRTAEPHGYMDDAIEEAIFKVQRQRGLPETGRLEADDYLMLLPAPLREQRWRREDVELLPFYRSDTPPFDPASLAIPASSPPNGGPRRSDRTVEERSDETQVAIAPVAAGAGAGALLRMLLRYGPPAITGSELARRSLEPNLQPTPHTAAPPPAPEQHPLPGGGAGPIGNPILTDPKPEILQPPQGTPAQAPELQQLPGSLGDVGGRLDDIILENRRGNALTKGQLHEVGKLVRRIIKEIGEDGEYAVHTHGGTDEDGNEQIELFVKSLFGQGTRGGSYSDLTITNTKTGRRLFIETVDTRADGSLTKWEAGRDARFRKNIKPGDILRNYRKAKPGKPVDLNQYVDDLTNDLREIAKPL